MRPSDATVSKFKAKIPADMFLESVNVNDSMLDHGTSCIDTNKKQMKISLQRLYKTNTKYCTIVVQSLHKVQLNSYYLDIASIIHKMNPYKCMY